MAKTCIIFQRGPQEARYITVHRKDGIRYKIKALFIGGSVYCSVISLPRNVCLFQCPHKASEAGLRTHAFDVRHRRKSSFVSNVQHPVSVAIRRTAQLWQQGPDTMIVGLNTCQQLVHGPLLHANIHLWRLHWVCKCQRRSRSAR